jgi:protoheme IX farnesyltransferase
MSASASVVVLRRTALADYLELTKPRITSTVVMTALVGYVMGTRGPVSFWRLGVALVGTALVAAGASALNMLLERRTDALMLRTRNRPVAAGRLRVTEALAFGLALTLAGLGILRFGANPLAALVALVTWASYLFAYTPLKTRTSLSTIVGAFPGALPPVIGWTAARGQVEPGAVVLFAILFLWQIPHFLAIAWIYREDYARGGLPMLPVLDPAGVVTGRQAVANSLALLLVSVVPTFAGLTGRLYLVGAVGLGVAFTSVAVWSAIRRTTAAARSLFLASILYLLALCSLLLVDRV